MYAHPTHIPQPPHSAGASLPGMLSKCSGNMSFTSVPGFRPHINANQIPSPIEAIELDRHNWADKTYTTLPGAHAPLSTTDFIAVDQGYTHCRIFCH